MPFHENNTWISLVSFLAASTLLFTFSPLLLNLLQA